MIANISEPLQPLAVEIDACHLDPANARRGHAVDRIAASLNRYGQRKPIVVNRGEQMKIEAGNGTWQAAKSLGWTHIAAVVVDDDPMTAVGFGIADNRLGDMSKWDADTLQMLIDGLDRDLDLPTGFADGELGEFLAGFLMPNDNDWAGMFGALPDGERAPFQQMTFTLHDEQVEQVKTALGVAKALGPFDSPNENSNGNALARICEAFVTDYGNG